MKDLWWPNIKSWNINMVRSVFIEEDVDRVIKIKVAQRGEDELVWMLEFSRRFSVCSTYHA